jgi:drug/metabolite transporter (DMT)-like permease
MPDRARRNAVLLLIVLSLVWSYNWIVMKQVLRYSGPFEFAAWRYALGTLVLFAALRWRGVSLRPPPWAPVLAIGLAQTFAFQALVQLALVDGGAGKTALLAYTMPFWAVLLAWGVLRERPSRVQWTSLAIAGGLAWAIGMVLSKRVFLRGGVSALSLTAWQMLAGSIGLVLLTLWVPERPIAWTLPFVLSLAYNALLASGLAWLLWSYVVERLPTSVAGVSSLVVPILGVLFAWAVLGEVPSLAEGAGMLLLAAALLLAALAPRAPPR